MGAHWLHDELRKMNEALLAQEQFHFRVNAETGAVTVVQPYCTFTWPNFQAYFDDPLTVPPYGRVWVHVE